MKQDSIGKPRIIFRDEHLIAVHKPNRMLVHRTHLDFYENVNLRRWLAAETGLKVDPVHRLDKATSGIVLFACHTEALNALRNQFVEQKVQKSYLLLARGFTAQEGTIEHEVKSDDGKARSAVTHFKTLAHTEVEVAISRYPTSRYSLVEALPKSGRFHQIRLHFAHLRHPVIGDTRHGDRKHNQYFRDTLGIQPLFLHAASLSFEHPNGGEVTIFSQPPDHFTSIRRQFEWNTGSGVEPEEST